MHISGKMGTTLWILLSTVWREKYDRLLLFICHCCGTEA